MPDRIRFLDLGRLHAAIRPELDDAWDRVVRTSSFIGGEQVTGFENEFAALHGLSHVAGCNSGTDALSLSLRALGVGPGDEVIVPDMTFAATAEAVAHVGARPVIADVDSETLLLTAASVEPALSRSTKAILPVHLFGNLVHLEDLKWMLDHAPVVIEDAAQAHLAEHEYRVGSLSHAACFSFFPGKNLGALGDAGAAGSNDQAMVGAIRKLRDHGRESKYVHSIIGVSSRLDGLQAALLRVKLRHLQDWTRRRQAIADRYDHAFADCPAVRAIPSHQGASRHLYPIRVPEQSRDHFRQQLGAAQIDTGIHYPVPLSRQAAFRGYKRIDCNVAVHASEELVSLPIDPLMTTDEVDRVIVSASDAARRIVHRRTI